MISGVDRRRITCTQRLDPQVHPPGWLEPDATGKGSLRGRVHTIQHVLGGSLLPVPVGASRSNDAAGSGCGALAIPTPSDALRWFYNGGNCVPWSTFLSVVGESLGKVLTLRGSASRGVASSIDTMAYSSGLLHIHRGSTRILQDYWKFLDILY